MTDGTVGRVHVSPVNWAPFPRITLATHTLPCLKIIVYVQYVCAHMHVYACSYTCVPMCAR